MSTLLEKTPQTITPLLQSVRKHFPALERLHDGQPVAYFDGPGGTQVPRQVVEAMTDYLFHHNANTHWSYPTSIETDHALQQSRQALADFFNASPTEVAFGNNMTTLTFHLSRAFGRAWGPGDEIIVTELDHQANVAPWRALVRERGVHVRQVPFDPETGELAWGELEKAFNSKTRLLAIGAASNALGTVSAVRDAVQLAHQNKALCFVDAVHYAAHRLIDVQALDCDFLVCSPYKFYGPHTGVLYARAELMGKLDVPKLDPASNEIPERFEIGTQNHEGIVGAGAAVDFLASLGMGATRRDRLAHAMTALHAEGDKLLARLWSGLSRIKGVRLYGPHPHRPRTPTVSFVVQGIPSVQVARHLAQQGIFVSNGNFYATGVVNRLGHQRDGLVRAGCACYTTETEVDRLLTAIADIAANPHFQSPAQNK